MKLVDLCETKTESQFYKTREQVLFWLKEMGIRGWTVNDDLTVDCDGTVRIKNRLITHFPVKFGKVAGNFDCRSSISLESLVGSPDEVGLDFDCSSCQRLKTLKGAPTIVKRDFSAVYCESLKSLEGSPAKVDGFIAINGCNKLKSLKGITPIIGGDVYATGCQSLTSLKDIHKYVKSITGEFHLGETNVKSHILGLLKIKGLTTVIIDDKFVGRIVNKYLPDGNLLDCVDELTDAGFEEYAKL